MAADSNEHVFNDDLLANTGDQSKVHALYAPLEEVLYHQELVDYFNKYNTRAETAKRKSRAWGKWAIALGATAIALAAVEIAAAVPGGDSYLSIVLGLVAASCGLLSIAIGATGLLFGQRKQEWLHNRFMGERIL